MPLYLVRHGQTAWNAEGRAQGRLDIPLDAVGEAQAHALVRGWTGPKPSVVWASDLGRSRRTAEILAEGLGLAAPCLDPRLREIGFGDWEGMDYREVRHRLAAIAAAERADPLDVRPPGGESRRDVFGRVAAFAADLAAASGPDPDAAVVGHGAALALMLARLLGAPPECAPSFAFDNTGVVELRPRTAGGWRLVRYNDLSHLTQMAQAAPGGDPIAAVH